MNTISLKKENDGIRVEIEVNSAVTSSWSADIQETLDAAEGLVEALAPLSDGLRVLVDPEIPIYGTVKFRKKMLT